MQINTFKTRNYAKTANYNDKTESSAKNLLSKFKRQKAKYIYFDIITFISMYLFFNRDMQQLKTNLFVRTKYFKIFSEKI